MTEKDSNPTSKIHSLEKFRLVLENINCYEDILECIDQLYEYASAHKKVYMILKVVRKKATSHYSDFDMYFKKFYYSKSKSKTSAFSKVGSRPPNFSQWIKGDREPPKKLPKKKIQKEAISINPKRLTRMSCQTCGSKFVINSYGNIEPHNCNNPYKKRKRHPRTISGGGANGTGKRR